MNRNRTAEEQIVRDGVQITHDKIVLAKQFILDSQGSSPRSLLEDFLKDKRAEKPEFVNLDVADVDTELSRVSNWLSWQRSFIEALWGLASSGLLILGGATESQRPSVTWATSRQKNSWSFDDLQLPLPSALFRPTWRGSLDTRLSEGDLLRHDFGEVEVPELIHTAIDEAVACFRADLFTASVAMLGKASEGAWLEAGCGLARRCPSDGEVDVDNLMDTLLSPFVGIAKKVVVVQDLYSQKAIFGNLWSRADVSPREIKAAAQWADVVRDSRNSVHYDYKPTKPNTYERVAPLLIAAGPHIGALLRVAQAAKED